MRIEKSVDYIEGLFGLPPADVIKYELQCGSPVVIRPSGTEAKLKVYLSVCDDNKENATILRNRILCEIEKIIDNFSKNSSLHN